MSIPEIENKILMLAAKHQIESEDEFAFLYELEAYDLILQYLIENSISLGNYDLVGLYNQDEEYDENRAEILSDIHLDVLCDPAPFEVHPDAFYLYSFHKKTFWPEIEE